ncbi:MAG: hypothetical protein Q9163_005757 [Psora crenata]
MAVVTPRPLTGHKAGRMEGDSWVDRRVGVKGTYGKDTLRPVTIKQVLDAQQPYQGAEFKIDDVEITQITFVGQIRNISTQTTNTTYKLDDGTGTIEVKQWVDVDAANGMDIDGGHAPAKAKLSENEWARVWGRLKDFNNKRHVGAHVIRPVTDKMEITYHLLEATYVHLYFTRGPLDQIKQEDGTGANSNGNGGREGGGDPTMNGQSMPSVSSAARRVYQTLKNSPQNNEGLHVQNIAAICKMNVADVMKAGEELLNHSMIFTTVDDNTWALLEF